MRKRSVTVKQIQRLDRIAIGRYGVPSLALMENAGSSVAEEILKLIRPKKTPRVTIVCGLGNNAGDGFVAARHLINAGVRTFIVLIGQGKQLKNDAAVNYRILKRLKYPIQESGARGRLSFQAIKSADIVVDAIFGVGLNREVQGAFRDAIDMINERARKVLSVDIPSGLDGTDGSIYGACVKADTTVTFTFSKNGFLKGQGPAHAGRVVVVDIGIPLQLQNKILQELK